MRQRPDNRRANDPSRASEHAFAALLRSRADARPPRHLRLPPDRGPAARDRGARRLAPRREPRADAPRRDRNRQDGDNGVGDRGAPAAGARDRAQQDARRTALQRVPGVLPLERGRVLRLLLRLLPARGVRPAGRPLHREGLVAERRHRPAPARRRRTSLADATRRRRRRLGVLHLRDRVAGGVARARAASSRSGRSTTATRCSASSSTASTSATTRCSAAGGSASRATSSRCSPRTSRPRTAISFFGDEVEQISHFDPLTGEVLAKLDNLTTGRRREYVTSKPTIERAVDEIRHELERRSRRSRRRAACSRRTGSGSAPSTTWR